MTGLNKIEEMKICLAWAAWKDINSLLTKPDKDNLDSVWHSIRKDVEDIFAKVNEDFQRIRCSFKTIILNMNPYTGWNTDSKNGQLNYNLWSLFFSVTDEDKLFFASPIRIASSLIHEYTHLQSFYQLGICGNSKEATPQQQIQIEIDAYQCEIDFLQRCIKLYDGQERYLRVFWVTKSDKMHRPLGVNIKSKQIQRGTSDIEAIIEGYQEIRDQYIKGKQDLKAYLSFNEKNDLNLHGVMANNLNLPIDRLLRTDEFKTVSLKI